MKSLIKATPVSMFFLVSAFAMTVIHLNPLVEEHERLFFQVNELIGSSLAFNVFMLAACIRYKYCMYNKVSCVALIGLNLVNIVFMNIHIDYHLYYSLFVQGIIFPFLLLVIVLLCNRR